LDSSCLHWRARLLCPRWATQCYFPIFLIVMLFFNFFNLKNILKNSNQTWLRRGLRIALRCRQSPPINWTAIQILGPGWQCDSGPVSRCTVQFPDYADRSIVNFAERAVWIVFLLLKQGESAATPSLRLASHRRLHAPPSTVKQRARLVSLYSWSQNLNISCLPWVWKKKSGQLYDRFLILNYTPLFIFLLCLGHLVHPYEITNDWNPSGRTTCKIHIFIMHK
jgi:hypothetical protein